MSNPNAPIETLYDWPLKASIWENISADGKRYYTVTFARTYRNEDGRLADASSFSGTDLLMLAELSREAYAIIKDLRRHRTPDLDAEGEADLPIDAEDAPAAPLPFNRESHARPRRMPAPR